MSLGFEKGRLYNRRQDIHARFGGQQQGGIITPSHHPAVIIITGEEGSSTRIHRSMAARRCLRILWRRPNRRHDFAKRESSDREPFN